MSARDPRPLDELSRQLRRAATPKIDFARMEARLMREARRPAPHRRPSGAGWLFAWAALALGFVAIFSISHRGPLARTGPAPTAASRAVPTIRDGDLLRIDDRIVSAGHEVSVEHRGRASWQLAPHSAARLRERGDRIVIRLESGSIRSQVVPSARAESYVIEAAHTRVAVHGTAFRVSLVQDQVEVSVSEGVVAVGPMADSPRFALGAGARGTFSEDGARGVISGSTEALPGAAPAVPSAKPAIASASARAAAKLRQAEPSLPPGGASEGPPARELAIGDIEAGVARVVQVANHCFRETAPTAEGVRVTAHTQVSLHITGAGLIARLDFQPPLAPAVDSCARARIQPLRFPSSVEGADVTRLLELNY